jgi:hypothetical protein
MIYEVVVIQARDESVPVAGYRYVLVIKHPTNQRVKAVAAGSIYELTRILYNSIDAEEWHKIEAGLALSGAWKGNLEMDDVNASHVFANF